MQDIFRKSAHLSAVLLARTTAQPMDATELALALDVAVADIPLLLGVASTSTPGLHARVDLEF